MGTILTVKEVKERLADQALSPDVEAIVAEAKELGLGDWDIKRIKEKINPNKDDYHRRDSCGDFDWNTVGWNTVFGDIPVSSDGRLSYDLRFDSVKVPKGQVGWANDDKDYSGQNLVVRDRRIYLLGHGSLPVANGSVYLDLSNSAKLFGKEPDHPEITSEEAAELISQASNVIDLLLQNPNSRCKDSYYGGCHAADLILSFDAYTSGLRPNFSRFKTASSQVNGELAFGTLEQVLSRAHDKASIVLVREGRSDCGSSAQKLGYAASVLCR